MPDNAAIIRRFTEQVLNNGEIKSAVTVHAHKFSKAAQEAIEKAGGKAVLIG